MKILALENSSAQGSVALLDNQKPPILLLHENDRKHSGAFFRSLAGLVDDFKTVDAIVVGLGPGSYAGVRIAISTAIGLSFGRGTGSVPSQDLGRPPPRRASSGRPSKLIGYPSICAIESAEYCVVGDARRQSFFFAHIDKGVLLEGPSLFSEIELRDKIHKLDIKMPIFASEELPRFDRVTVRYPSALVLARLVERGVVHASQTPLQPIYLREPHITIPK